jgi:DNA-directed RNA polymerase subunit M/transcription elongation factor TFIIS
MNLQPERKNIYNLYIDIVKLDENRALNLEKATYNYTIDYCRSHNMLPSWSCFVFKNMYIAKAKSMIANIRPENKYLSNGILRDMILTDKIQIEKIPYLKPEEIRPDVWDKVIEEGKKYDNNLDDDFAKKSTKTDMFYCSKCKKNETSYYTMQCRSADESESVFISCLNCSHQWRIG